MATKENFRFSGKEKYFPQVPKSFMGQGRTLSIEIKPMSKAKSQELRFLVEGLITTLYGDVIIRSDFPTPRVSQDEEYHDN